MAERNALPRLFQKIDEDSQLFYNRFKAEQESWTVNDSEIPKGYPFERTLIAIFDKAIHKLAIIYSRIGRKDRPMTNRVLCFLQIPTLCDLLISITNTVKNTLRSIRYLFISVYLSLIFIFGGFVTKGCRKATLESWKMFARALVSTIIFSIIAGAIKWVWTTLKSIYGIYDNTVLSKSLLPMTIDKLYKLLYFRVNSSYWFKEFYRELFPKGILKEIFSAHSLKN